MGTFELIACPCYPVAETIFQSANDVPFANNATDDDLLWTRGRKMSECVNFLIGPVQQLLGTVFLSTSLLLSKEIHGTDVQMFWIVVLLHILGLLLCSPYVFGNGSEMYGKCGPWKMGEVEEPRNGLEF